VYGHSTALVYMPERRIGAVVMSNEDIVNGRTQKLANLALSHLLRARYGEPLPAAPVFRAAPADLAALAGSWESQSYWLEMTAAGRGDLSGQPVELTAMEKDRYFLNSRLHADQPVTVERDGDGVPLALVMGAQRFTRVPAGRPPLPPEWRSLKGSYGPAFIPLVIHEKHGRLYATTENLADYRLTPVNRRLLALPPGLYHREHLAVIPGPDGRPAAVELADMILRRID
jgi:hypothetical protein